MPQDRIGIRDLTICLVLYAAALIASIHLLDHGVAAPWIVPLSLLPMLPARGIVYASMRRYRRLDEFQQRNVAEAIVFAFVATAVVTFSYGFLQNTAHAPNLSYFFVWAIMGTFWIVGSIIVRVRYR